MLMSKKDIIQFNLNFTGATSMNLTVVSCQKVVIVNLIKWFQSA